MKLKYKIFCDTHKPCPNGNRIERCLGCDYAVINTESEQSMNNKSLGDF